MSWTCSFLNKSSLKMTVMTVILINISYVFASPCYVLNPIDCYWCIREMIPAGVPPWCITNAENQCFSLPCTPGGDCDCPAAFIPLNSTFIMYREAVGSEQGKDNFNLDPEDAVPCAFLAHCDELCESITQSCATTGTHTIWYCNEYFLQGTDCSSPYGF
jgi:hypothetical protein